VKVIIEVTQQDIDNGIRNACSKCPIALALTRTMGSAFSEVTITTCSTHFPLRENKEDLRAYIPEIARNFIQTFDKGLPVKPLSFELEMTTERF
jgi:hypothetical protein